MKDQSTTVDPKDSRLPVTDVVALAMAGALIAALAENGTTMVQRLILHRLGGATTGFLWIVPLYYTAAFGILAAGLVLMTRLVTRGTAVQLVVTTCGALVAFILLLLGLYGKVHQWALAVLALGVGVQLGRWAARRAERVPRRARVFTVLAGTFVLIPALLNPALQRWLDRRELAGLPAAEAGAPNVLLIILDTVRAASLSLHGNTRPTTPNFQRLAKRGVVFDHTYSTSPWTLPSHASMFTGRYPHELTADFLTPLSTDPPTLAEAFRDSGYQTAGFVANLFYCTEESGLARGFIHYEDYLHAPGQFRRATALGQFLDSWRRKDKLPHRSFKTKPGPVITHQFLSWLEGAANRPFFAFLNYFDAHAPYQAPAALLQRFESGNPIEQRYEAAIASLDIEVAGLIDSLEQLGLLENTVVIISSDHGEQVGEHGLVAHANSLYVQALHIPLIFLYGDRIPRGMRVNDRVSLRDLTQTVATLAGLRHTFPGESLSRFWDNGAGQSGERSFLLSEVSRGVRTPASYPITRGAMKSLVDSNLHFIVNNGDGQEQLYDLVLDPFEERDLSSSDLTANRLVSMRRLLQTVLSSERETIGAASNNPPSSRNPIGMEPGVSSLGRE